MTGVAVFALDLTKRKRAENALLQAKEEWERTFESVPDLIAILDNQFQIMRMNKAMERRLATFPKGCTGLQCYEHVHGAKIPPAFCPHATASYGGEHVVDGLAKLHGLAEHPPCGIRLLRGRSGEFAGFAG